MKENIILILKGMFIGIGKVIPGVSGSLIALSLGLYEDIIDILSKPLKKIKDNIIFLGMISIGIIISIILGSKVINFMLNTFYMQTMFLFSGLILGSLEETKGKANKKCSILFTIIIFIIMLIVLNIKTLSFEFSNNYKDYLYIIIIGFIDAVSMIIPGLSGTAIFMLIGCYDELLYIFSNLLKLLVVNPFMIISLSIGLFIGIILTSKLMRYLLQKKSSFIYSVILGFSISSILFLLLKSLNNFKIIELIISIILLILGYVITKPKKHKIYKGWYIERTTRSL